MRTYWTGAIVRPRFGLTASVNLEHYGLVLSVSHRRPSIYFDVCFLCFGIFCWVDYR